MNLRTLILAVVSMPLVNFVAPAVAAEPNDYHVYFGTYTEGKSKGIYVAKFDASTGAVTAPELAAEIRNPSFVAIHPTGKFVYAVGEIDDFSGKKTGAVSAFARDAKTGKLTLLNQQDSGGAAPCHIVVDPTGKTVLVANYTGGSVSSYPIGDDGKLKPAASTIQHQGSSVDKGRQQAPHAHSINVDPSGKFAMAADLGLDKVLVYRFDAAAGTLSPNDPPSTSVAPGSGPRHFAFHPSGKYAYVINEMLLTVTAFDYDAEKGSLTAKQTISTIPDKNPGGYSTAEIQVHPSGKFLYGSNRGHHSLAIFSIGDDGKLTAVGHVSTNGKTPRNFTIDPTGKYIFAANQDSSTVVVFKIDQETGKLSRAGESLPVANPVCVKFVRAS